MLKDSALYVLWHKSFKMFWCCMQQLKIEESDPEFARINSLKSQLDIFYIECDRKRTLQIIALLDKIFNCWLIAYVLWYKKREGIFVDKTQIGDL